MLVHPLGHHVPSQIHWIGRVLLDCFRNASDRDANFRKVFPEAPFVAYRRTKNIRDKLVRAKHYRTPGNSKNQQRQATPTKSMIERQMNHSGVITNWQSKKTAHIAGGGANTVGCVYAAECVKHMKMYVGQTGGPLNVRFNGHRSDTIHHPDRCELSQHFASNNCSMDKDLRVSVLEYIPEATETYRMYKEDIWITRLQTNRPTGLNVSKHDFGQTYKAMFG